MTIQEAAERATANIMWANREAARLEAELVAARERVAAATRQAEAPRRELERHQAAGQREVTEELRQLRKQADGVLAAKPDRTRPSSEARVLARMVLLDPAAANDTLRILPRLAQLDPTWARLHGAQDLTQHFIERGSGDLAAADDLECKLHRAALARLRWLAGEVE